MALQRASRFWWRAVVGFTLVFNLNYGPFGKGHWFQEKKNFADSWFASITISNATFVKYAPAIAADFGLEAPETDADYERLLAMVRTKVASFYTKGPLVKMMRWFAWFVSAFWYAPQLHSIKMLLEAYLLSLIHI